MRELVVFFSRKDENYVSGVMKNLETGNTETVARMIQKATGAELFVLEPAHPYSRNYNECVEQAMEDLRNSARPEIKKYPETIAPYDVIYLGFPNYCGTMPMLMFTFLEHFDFTGKIIKPFCTHEGSGLGRSVDDIRKMCPTARVESGLAIHGGSVQKAGKEIGQWI